MQKAAGCLLFFRCRNSSENNYISIEPFYGTYHIELDFVHNNFVDVNVYQTIPRHHMFGIIITEFIHNRRKDTKIVMTMRNMKDTFVSMYHMWKNFKLADQNIPDDQKWQKSFPYLLHCKGGR